MPATTQRPPRGAPDFRRDLRRGQAGEKWLSDLLGDGEQDTVSFEVKTCSWIATTSNVALELSHSPGATGAYVPSGLAITTADVFAVNVAGADGAPVAALLFPTGLLLRTVYRLITTGVVKVRVLARQGSCPTRGILCPLPVLLSALADQSTFDALEGTAA